MDAGTLLLITILIGSILVSITIHEAAHAFMSYWLGDDTAKHSGRLTLNPVAHIDPFLTILMPLLLFLAGAPPFGAAKPVPFNPSRLRFGEYGAALVGLAGPVSNVLLALLAAVILNIVGVSVNGLTQDLLSLFVLVNVAFFLFNMIPFPPLDGSRVLYAFAPDSVRDFVERIESLGFAAIIVFFLIFYAFLREPFYQILSFLMNVLGVGY